MVWWECPSAIRQATGVLVPISFEISVHAVDRSARPCSTDFETHCALRKRFSRYTASDSTYPRAGDAAPCGLESRLVQKVITPSLSARPDADPVATAQTCALRSSVRSNPAFPR